MEQNPAQRDMCVLQPFAGGEGFQFQLTVPDVSPNPYQLNEIKDSGFPCVFGRIL